MLKFSTLLLLLYTALTGAEIQWQDSFTSAQAKAKKVSKPMLVIITTQECPWCRKLEATTLTEKEIIKRINSHFIPVHVTRDKSDYPKFLSASMIPMNYFLDGNGKVIYSISGYWPAEDYHSILDDALRKAKK